MAQTFFVDDGIAALYTLDGIITVCDSKHIETRLDDVKPEGGENEAQEQVAFADRILLNKTDLVDEAELPPIEARLKTLNPTAQIFRTQQSKVALARRRASAYLPSIRLPAEHPPAGAPLLAPLLVAQ